METENNNTPIKSDQHVDTRDFRVKSISIVSSDGQTLEISPIVIELQIRQDLYLGIMSGELVLNDGNDIHSQLGLHGGEYIYINIEVPQQENIKIKKSFRIYKICNRYMVDNAQRYNIHFMSDELFESYTKKISKAYKNSKVSDVVADILKNQLKIPSNKTFIESTGETVSIVIPNWRPIEAINWLASRAISGDRNTFFFFETLEGFHFRSLQSLYKANPTIKNVFTLENKRGKVAIDDDKFGIDRFESLRDFDILQTIGSGGYSMKLQTVDPVDRRMTNTEYKISDADTLYANKPMTNVNGLFNKTDSYFLSYLKINGIEQWIKRTMSLAILNSSITELAVPGNMGIQVGTVISINLPYAIVPVDGDMFDKRKSGKYLVIGVNHKFDLITQKFTSLLVASRDSQPEPYNPADTKLSEKVSKLNEN